MHGRRWLTATIISTLLILGVAVMAARNKHETQTIPLEGADEAVVNFNFAAGTLNVAPKDMADFAVFDMDYDPDRIDVTLDHQVTGKKLRLDVELETRGHGDWGHDRNTWNVDLSTRTPSNVKFDVGAAKADIDLGGVPIRELSMDIGAASGTLEFSKPNPERLREFSIDAGASSLNLVSLGNANFDNFKFSGGAGKFDLDLRGKYTGESEAKLEVGVGSADITLPADVPVRIESDDNNWFSSVDIHDRKARLDEIDDGVYESPGFSKATARLVVKLDVGLGSVDVAFK